MAVTWLRLLNIILAGKEEVQRENRGKREEIKYINKDLIAFPSLEATKLRRKRSKKVSSLAYCCMH